MEIVKYICLDCNKSMFLSKNDVDEHFDNEEVLCCAFCSSDNLSDSDVYSDFMNIHRKGVCVNDLLEL